MFSGNSSDSLDSRGASNSSAFGSNATSNDLEQSSKMLLSQGDDEGEEEGKDEKDGGDEKKEEDTGPDRIWGAAKLG